MVYIVVLLVAASAIVYWAASNANHGVYWADRICTEVQILCDQPKWLLAVCAAAIIGEIVRRVMRT
jgi:hypothetical protein